MPTPNRPAHGRSAASRNRTRPTRLRWCRPPIDGRPRGCFWHGSPHLVRLTPTPNRQSEPFNKGVGIRLEKPSIKSLALIVGLFLALVGTYVGALALTGTAVGAEVQPVRPIAKSCKTIPAKTYNKKLRVRRTITGNDQRFRSKPVCVAKWRELLRSIKKQRHICKKSAITTGATYYGGPSDSMTTGTSGKYGDLSDHPWSFAELGMGNAMGGLPPLSWWYVHSHNNGKTKQAQKRDIGGGGGPIGGYTRGFDAWHPLASYLGLLGNGVVTLAKRNCWAG